MKIAALSPQFIIEPPAGEKTTEEKKAAADLHLKIVKPQEPETPNAGHEAKSKLDDETREGLKRLSRLIQRTKDENKKNGKDRQRQRALANYIRVAENEDPRGGVGTNFNGFA